MKNKKNPNDLGMQKFVLFMFPTRCGIQKDIDIHLVHRWMNGYGRISLNEQHKQHTPCVIPSRSLYLESFFRSFLGGEYPF